jgi:putative nucleotidyltransferase with HDIG domain
MMDDPRISAHELAQVVSKDQSLVSSILRIVNSAYYGLLWRISSVSQAVVLLGFRTIRNLVLAATVMKSFGGHARAQSFDRTAHWKHSIGCAVASNLVAKKWRRGAPDEAFLAGLIHDIGRVIMDQRFPEEFEEALRLAASEDCPLHEAEAQVFGLTHAELGRHVAQKWNFPDEIIAAIGDHHGPGPRGEWTAMPAVVHVADVLARRAGLALGGRPPELDEGALVLLGREAEEIEQLEKPFAEAYGQANVFEELAV